MLDTVGNAAAIDDARQSRGLVDQRWMTVLGRGLAMRCPSCGRRSAFDGYLHVHDVCEDCGAHLGAYPSDDAPPYLTLVIVLHIVIGLLVVVDRGGATSSFTLLAIFLPLTVILTLALLRPIKGLTLAAMMKVGFGIKTNTTISGRP